MMSFIGGDFGKYRLDVFFHDKNTLFSCEFLPFLLFCIQFFLFCIQ